MSAFLEWRGVDEAALTQIAQAFAVPLAQGGVILLEGDLGAGKTTFSRALLTTLGVGERIKSPTYSLIESYRIGDLQAHHLDLYRIAAADELEWLGLADLLDASSLLLIEWPERGSGALPPADLILHFEHAGERRNIAVRAQSARGRECLRILASSGVRPHS
ncbi:MAG: tRNA (adenosine(37)-N6)-threonylcarbamoyltransferase complex ATPase subunit type 1 TsaE [Lysobacterales bacterium 63-13]|nr:MAG: tRNA (adenosine(37)-N6)-threonylcarbamoyltransferase complex ATPase subunit type 1 TsaE [Xanthomonadales bacterium 63-13]